MSGSKSHAELCAAEYALTMVCLILLAINVM